MSATLLASIVIRALALGWALSLLRRPTDWRFGFMAALIAYLTFCQIFRVDFAPDFWTLTLETNLEELRMFGVSLLAFAAAYHLRRILDDRIAAHAALQTSEQRLKDFIEASDDRYWEMDESFRFSRIADSAGGDRLAAVPSPLGRARSDLADVDPKSDQAWRRHRNNLEARRRFRGFHYSVAGQDGMTQHWRVTGKPIFHRDGGFRGYRGTSTDETAEVERRQRHEQARQASEARFQDLYDNAPAMFVSIEAETGKVVQCKRTLLRATSYANSEIIGRAIIDLYHRACAVQAHKSFRCFAETGEVRDEALQLRRKDGSKIDVTLDVSAVKDEQGRVLQSRSVWRDITDRKQAREALRQSQQRFKDFAEIASDWYWETDTELRFTYLSDHIIPATGLRPDAYLGRSRAELSGLQVDQRKWRSHLGDLEARRPIRNFTYAQRVADGRVLHFRISGKPRYGPDGVFLGYRGVGSDITAEVEAEQRRREAEVRLARAIETIPAVFALFDPSDRLVICNQKYRDIYETESVPIVPGVGFRQLVEAFAQRKGVDGRMPDAEDWKARRLARRKTPACAYQYNRGDDEWAEVSDYVLEDGSVISVGIDISERKRSEDTLRQHNSELAQLQRRFTLDEMASTLAHELNQPLTAVMNYSSGCLRRIRSGKFDESTLDQAVDQIREQAERASNVLRRIGRFVGHAAPEASAVDLVEVTRAVSQLLEPELRSRRIKLKLDLAHDAQTVLANRIELEQVVLNLLKNSAEAMAESASLCPKITIRSFAVGTDKIELVVSDTGPGFRSDLSERIFTPFVTTKTDGMGMGLSISRTIVEAHGGHIAANNGANGGAVVRITLPKLEESLKRVA